MISDVNAYKDYLMMVNATPVLVRMVRESQMDVHIGPLKGQVPNQPMYVTK